MHNDINRSIAFRYKIKNKKSWLCYIYSELALKRIGIRDRTSSIKTRPGKLVFSELVQVAQREGDIFRIILCTLKPYEIHDCITTLLTLISSQKCTNTHT